MHDIAVVSIPFIPYQLPPAAPAVLVGQLRSRGFKAVALEHNIEFKIRCADEDLLARLQVYWGDETVALDSLDLAPYQTVMHSLAQDLVNSDSVWWGISVFTNHSRRYAEDFISVLQQYRRPHNKILVGGLGIDDALLTRLGKQIDAYILGEGEIALEKLLLGHWDYPGINSPGLQIDNLDQLAGPDYSDYRYLDHYDHFYNTIHVQLTGSRGCVRNCSFCNVADLWPRFRYRSGDLIAQDMIGLYESTGVKDFHFTDSLINGNVRELRNMMIKVSEYRQQHGVDITWGGQWIARKQKGLPRDYYDLIASSGARAITIGVETGSDRVRADMRKGFTNQDLDQELEQFSRRGIQCGFYLFSGYPTETWEDFEATLDMLKRYTRYVADGTIMGSYLGMTFMVLPGTPIEQQEGVTWERQEGSSLKWRSLVTDLDYLESLRRRIILHRVYNDLGWPSRDTKWELRRLLLELKKHAETSQANHDHQVQNIQDIAARFSLPSQPHEFVVQMNVVGNRVNSWPRLRIKINNHLVADDIEIQGAQTLEFAVSHRRRRNIITWELLNKDPCDTVVDDHNNIVQDKNVVIESLVIDGVRIRAHEIYLRSSFRCAKTNTTRPLNGVFEPGRLRFYFENPIIQYFVKLRHNHWDHKQAQNTAVIAELTKYYSELSVHS
jgi:radical SAM superfamily enzyme YgiQ (UPF0313 family)